MEKVKIKNYPMASQAPAVLVGATVNGKPNYATVGAFGFVCLEPVIYVSLKSTHYTTVGVKENGYFSVNIPSAKMVQITDYCGSVTGAKTDKSTLFTPFYDEPAKAPLISECPLNYFCRVVQSVPIRGFEVFFGEILATYLAQQCLTDEKPDPLKIDPLIMMGSGYYNLGQEVGKIFKEGTLYSTVTDLAKLRG
ncbi:MAG: flavin reductase family protein [Firmicutes bacterium]|nr:flavin reductase family protein [Bacillota bacterium]